MTKNEEITERLKHLRYPDLAEVQSEATKTWVEKANPETLDLQQKIFLHRGAIVLRGLLPENLIDAYCAVREKLPKDRTQKNNYWGGWGGPCPFMECEELRDLALCGALSQTLKHLTGEQMGLNLALTGWVSTQRNFHSDNYLNPRGLGSRYVAVWMSLDKIDADSGPFQYVVGSHKWPVISQEKLFSHLTPEERTSPHWPSWSQDAVARMCEEEIQTRGAKIEEFIPERGDVLVWHSNLVHRGSVPKNPDLLRKSLICHYSGTSTRAALDMPRLKLHKDSGMYFNLPTDGSVSP